MEEGVKDSEKIVSLESVQDVRLLALLHDLEQKDGRKGAAAKLGVHRKTVAVCVDTGTLSARMRDALERFLQTGGNGDTAEAEDSLEERVAALEEAVAAIEAEGRGFRDGVAERARVVEGRLARLEARRGVQGTEKAAPEDRQPAVSGVDRRRHPELVTVNPEPGEERVYGEATPLIVEWRRVRIDLLEAGDRLASAMAEERMRELEIALIGEFKLTLPPETYPWDDRARTNAAHLRMQALDRVRGERIRAQLQRWIRRILTLGLWWK